MITIYKETPKKFTVSADVTTPFVWTLKYNSGLSVVDPSFYTIGVATTFNKECTLTILSTATGLDGVPLKLYCENTSGTCAISSSIDVQLSTSPLISGVTSISGGTGGTKLTYEKSGSSVFYEYNSETATANVFRKCNLVEISQTDFGTDEVSVGIPFSITFTTNVVKVILDSTYNYNNIKIKCDITGGTHTHMTTSDYVEVGLNGTPNTISGELKIGPDATRGDTSGFITIPIKLWGATSTLGTTFLLKIKVAPYTNIVKTGMLSVVKDSTYTTVPVSPDNLHFYPNIHKISVLRYYKYTYNGTTITSSDVPKTHAINNNWLTCGETLTASEPMATPGLPFFIYYKMMILDSTGTYTVSTNTDNVFYVCTVNVLGGGGPTGFTGFTGFTGYTGPTGPTPSIALDFNANYEYMMSDSLRDYLLGIPTYVNDSISSINIDQYTDPDPNSTTALPYSTEFTITPYVGSNVFNVYSSNGSVSFTQNTYTSVELKSSSCTLGQGATGSLPITEVTDIRDLTRSSTQNTFTRLLNATWLNMCNLPGAEVFFTLPTFPIYRSTENVVGVAEYREKDFYAYSFAYNYYKLIYNSFWPARCAYEQQDIMTDNYSLTDSEYWMNKYGSI